MNEGYISILALVLLSLILTVSIYYLNISFYELDINKSESDYLANYYGLESNLIHFIYNEEYSYDYLYPLIFQKFDSFAKNPHKEIEIMDQYSNPIGFDLKFDGIDPNYELHILVKNNKEALKASNSKLYAKLNYINPLLLRGEAFISSMDLSDRDMLYFEEFFKGYNYDYIYNNLDSLIDVKDLFIYRGPGEGFLLDIDREFISLYIENSDLSLFNQNSKYKGVICVDGNLYIEDDFQFEGIIIVKGDIVLAPEAYFKNSGLVICHEILDDEVQIELEFNSNVIFQFRFFPEAIYLELKNLSIY